MKDGIRARYLEDKLSYKMPRGAVIEAWDAIEESEPRELPNSKPQRCQAVTENLETPQFSAGGLWGPGKILRDELLKKQR